MNTENMYAKPFETNMIYNEASKTAECRNTCISNIRVLATEIAECAERVKNEVDSLCENMVDLEKLESEDGPSLTSLVNASRKLNVSMDLLMSNNISTMNDSELVLSELLEKLKKETGTRKCVWKAWDEADLNNLHPYGKQVENHPLFTDTIYENRYDCYGDSLEEVARSVFRSHNFGLKTEIAGTCYETEMEDGTRFFLMNICDTTHRSDDEQLFAKELWMETAEIYPAFVVANNSVTQVAKQVDALYSIVAYEEKRITMDADVKNAVEKYLRP